MTEEISDFRGPLEWALDARVTGDDVVGGLYLGDLVVAMREAVRFRSSIEAEARRTL